MGIFHRQREFLETMHAAREGRLREAITDGSAQPQDVSTGNVRVFQPSPATKAPAVAKAPVSRVDSPVQAAPATKSPETKKPKSKSRVEWNTDTFDKWIATDKLPKKKPKAKEWNTTTFDKWIATGQLPKTKKSDKSKRKRAA